MSGNQKYNITLKEGASEAQLAEAKKQCESQGGTVTHEFKIIKGFTAEFPPDAVHILDANEHIVVELDTEVKTQ